jgi:hypothetical protein
MYDSVFELAVSAKVKYEIIQWSLGNRCREHHTEIFVLIISVSTLFNTVWLIHILVAANHVKSETQKKQKTR